MEYEHVQHAPLALLILAAVGLPCALASVLLGAQALPMLILVLVLVVPTAFMFGSLTVRDEGEWLAVRFGPLPVFRKHIPYARITSVERSRTSILDGWGVHWFPGRGTTYNLWGFDCVKLGVHGRTIQIGTDDVDHLVAFLRSKMPAST